MQDWAGVSGGGRGGRGGGGEDTDGHRPGLLEKEAGTEREVTICEEMMYRSSFCKNTLLCVLF